MEIPKHTYRKLKIWQKSLDLVTEVYSHIGTFPAEETFGLSSQLKRSIVSVPSNIAEGYGREGKQDFLRFLNIAMSSLFEFQTQWEIAFNPKFIGEEKFLKIYEDTREVERMLSSYIRKIKNQ
ncbi:four helix bundle protein [Flavobacteriaceae bacterium TK19130]|nr:four helix bundle protein [Thermobacterium salinum]